VKPEERFERIERQTEKNTEAMKDLIVVARSITDAQLKTDGQIGELRQSIAELREAMREAQKETDERLNILIDTVDRIIRRNGKESA